MTSNSISPISSLKKRPLGRTGINVSPICYGCASAFARNLITDDKAIALFRHAVKLGINFFDTGRSYGKAEERIGMAIHTFPALHRDDLVIATKFDLSEKEPFSTTRINLAWARHSVETSLKKMRIDYLDVLYLHEPNPAALNDNQIFSFFDELKRQGLIRASGVNTFDVELASRVAHEKLFDVVMIDHNIATRRDTVIAKLYEAGIGVVAGEALAQALFLKKLFKISEKKDLWYLLRAFGKKQSRELYKRARKFKFLNNLKGITGAQAALGFILNNSNLASASLSSCNIARLEECVKAIETIIPNEILQRIENA